MQKLKQHSKPVNKTENSVEVHNLSYKIMDSTILEDVSIHIKKGAFVGVIGPNGSGKSTLLRHIYRAIMPPKKCVYINGREVETMSYRSVAQQVTVMRQENSTDFDFSVLDMVLMGRAPYRKLYERDTDEDKRIALNALAFMGMEDLAHRSFFTLSGGEKQRVLIARSLAQEADILILDEPTNHLDVHYQWLLMDIVKQLDKTIIAVFHDLNIACSYCDELYVLNHGKVVAQGKPRDVCTQRLLEEVFRVKTELFVLEDGKPHIVFKGSIQKD